MKLENPSKTERKFDLRNYSDLIKTVAKVEYKKISLHYIIDYSEVLNIASQTIYTLSEYPEFKYYNTSYLSTAIKWAIRNEIRRRYKWYFDSSSQPDAQPDMMSKSALQGSVYSTILSIDDTINEESNVSLQVKDSRYTPDEYAEFKELKTILEKAIATLPPREQALIEAKFFRGKKLVELSDEFDVTISRISRIIHSGVAKLRVELEQNNWN